MVEGTNVVDATAVVRSMVAAEMANVPLTLGFIETCGIGSPVQKVKYTVEVVGSTKRRAVSIEIDIKDGRTLESVESMKSRLVEAITHISRDRRW